MRSLMMAGVIGALAACGAAPPRGMPSLVACPDPDVGCTRSNGTGVYMAEEGSAQIDPAFQLMITHFINTGRDVRFQGRYFDQTLGGWRFLSEPGIVLGADYLGHKSLTVARLFEEGTVPHWSLFDTTTTPPTPYDATGDELRDLKLFITFDVVGHTANRYILDFAGPAVAPPSNVGPRPARPYSMQWRAHDNDVPIPYCQDDKHAPDAVVFQGGIDVHPVTGVVTRPVVSGPPQIVTVSCSRGAPALVYSWNYDYVGANTFYFDAGIQMKRASYCADGEFYTVAGTPIQIADDHPFNRAINQDSPASLEASWTPQGASCLNPEDTRHGDIAKRKRFDGSCNGRALPRCTARCEPQGQTCLVDRPETPIPLRP